MQDLGHQSAHSPASEPDSEGTLHGWFIVTPSSFGKTVNTRKCRENLRVHVLVQVGVNSYKISGQVVGLNSLKLWEKGKKNTGKCRYIGKKRCKQSRIKHKQNQEIHQ